MMIVYVNTQKANSSMRNYLPDKNAELIMKPMTFMRYWNYFLVVRTGVYLRSHITKNEDAKSPPFQNNKVHNLRHGP